MSFKLNWTIFLLFCFLFVCFNFYVFSVCCEYLLFTFLLLFLYDAGINTFTTTRHLLHSATVRCAAACYPSHNSGPAKWDACSHVCPAHSPSPAQQCRHGDGGWHHHGHVSWWASVSVFWIEAKFVIPRPAMLIFWHFFESQLDWKCRTCLVLGWNLPLIRSPIFVLSGTLLTTPSPAPVAPHQVTMPTYRPPGTASYSYVPPQWWREGSVSMMLPRFQLLF